MKLTAFIFLAYCPLVSIYAQTTCDPSQYTGPNLVTNGGFESGDQDFSTEISYSWNASGTNAFSSPDEYWISGDAFPFNPGGNFSGSPHSGSNFMMVDGQCSDEAVIWEQTVNVEAGFDYFFSVYIATIAPTPNNPAKLKFRINGVEQDTLIDAPANVDIWERYDQVWNSGAVSGPVTIEIIDVLFAETGSCGAANEDDFGLDDIVFQKGCPPSAGGPQPDLGPDATLCGTNGTLTLDPGIASDPDIEIFWSTGSNDGDYTLDVSAPGTYSVCVDSANTCIRADSIVITDDFTVDIGSNTALCDPASVTLDAEHTGPYVRYEWYKNDTLISEDQTIEVSEAARYRVKVRDTLLSAPSCEAQEDSVDISITGGAPDPQNQFFCTTQADTTVDLNVSGSGNYNWYDAATGGTLLQSSSNTYTTPTLTGPGNYTYYVEDVATSTDVAGASTEPTGGSIYNGDYMMELVVYNDIDITEVTMNVHNYSGPTSIDIGLDLHDENATDNGSNIISSSDLVTVALATGKNEIVLPVTNLATLTGGISSPTTYYISVQGVRKDGPMYTYSTVSYPYTTVDASGDTIVNITGGIENGSFSTDEYGYFYDINIEYGSRCSRTPITATWNCALPTRLLNFEGRRDDFGVVHLKWTTSEKNINYFEVWGSNDASEFTKATTVSDYDQHDNLLLYRASIQSSNNYFKLIYYNENGAIGSSNVIHIGDTDINFSVYPNPGMKVFTFCPDNEMYSYNIMLTDVSGKMIWMENSVNKEFTFGESLLPGVYLLHTTNQYRKNTIKLIKK